MVYYIYEIQCNKTNRRYIGVTSQYWKIRIQQHYNALNQNKHCNKLLQSDWNRYGEQAFISKCLETRYDDNNKFEVERQYIKKAVKQYGEFVYNIHHNEYNDNSNIESSQYYNTLEDWFQNVFIPKFKQISGLDGINVNPDSKVIFISDNKCMSECIPYWILECVRLCIGSSKYDNNSSGIIRKLIAYHKKSNAKIHIRNSLNPYLIRLKIPLRKYKKNGSSWVEVELNFYTMTLTFVNHRGFDFITYTVKR